MAFCDFCKCEDCQAGTPYLQHAQCEDGRWICDTCYNYELCIEAVRDICKEKDCGHRPKIVSDWSDWSGIAIEAKD